MYLFIYRYTKLGKMKDRIRNLTDGQGITDENIDELFYIPESIYDVPLSMGDRFYESNFDERNPPKRISIKTKGQIIVPIAVPVGKNMRLSMFISKNWDMSKCAFYQ